MLSYWKIRIQILSLDPWLEKLLLVTKHIHLTLWIRRTVGISLGVHHNWLGSCRHIWSLLVHIELLLSVRLSHAKLIWERLSVVQSRTSHDRCLVEILAAYLCKIPFACLSDEVLYYLAGLRWLFINLVYQVLSHLGVLLHYLLD